MRKISNTQKNNYTFAIMVTALFVGIVSIIISFYSYQQAQKQALEAERLKIVMFLAQKNDLEECMNASTDKEIKFESFELLLQHSIHQDVSVTTMNNMIQKCRATLNS